MLKLLRFWWRFEGTVSRAQYVRHGVALSVVKFIGDVAIVWHFVGQLWNPADYLRPFAPFLPIDGSTVPVWMVPALALWTLPFLWVGVTLTARRLADAGWPMPLVLLFFVPWVNYALMLWLCLAPTRNWRVIRDPDDPESMSRGAASLVAIVSGAVLGGVIVAISVQLLRSYSAGLFLGAPFVTCTFTGWLLVRLRPAATEFEAAAVSFLMLFVVTLGLLVAGWEGVGCLVMASPLAAAVGYFGGVLGHQFAQRPQPKARTSWLGLVIVPSMLLTGLPGSGALRTHEVYSAVEIDAPPEIVWPRVIAFSPIGPPSELMFRSGIAYPIRARIDGAGVGAIRYCEFSTGAFVEPITAWETNRRLAFDVAASPAPMRELTPYGGVAPPHLKGFLTSKRGEFRLVALGDGRTRLEGRTWYTLDMGPEAYWQLYTDRIIHAIHMRVLDHIKREAELAPR